MAYPVAVKLFKLLIEIGRGVDSPYNTGIISLMNICVCMARMGSDIFL